MTIRHRYDTCKTLVTCDRCFDSAQTEEFTLRTPYDAITKRIKSTGWKVRHLFGAHFSHFCPACALIDNTSASYQQRIHA